ncbi:MAG: DinB family protein [Fimbriimonadaceae bacterium]
MPVPYLIEALSATPGLMGAALRRLQTERTDCPTHAGRFSPREVVAHLADWEPIFFSRMELAVVKPNSTVPVYDEGDRAIELGYSGWETMASLSTWAAARAQTVAWLSALEPGQWDAEFVHPERGSFTVTRQATMMLAHDIYHLVQLEEAGRA